MAVSAYLTRFKHMSAKRSFDIGARPVTSPSRKKVAPARKKKETHTPKVRRPKKLRERREAKRQQTSMFFVVALLLFAAALLYGMWRPEVRIQEVHAKTNEDKMAVESLVHETLRGRVYHVLPKDSFFFYPEEEVTSAIRAAYPKVRDLSVRRDGFSAVYIDTIEREQAFVWCGTPLERTDACYQADETGFIFDVARDISSTTSMLRVYAYLHEPENTSQMPLRAQVAGYEHIPAVLSFIQTIEALGVPIESAAIREDEIDLYVPSGTRITYVLGTETQAERDARAAFPNLNLIDGSLSYVDLRFPSKVYYKRIDMAE